MNLVIRADVNTQIGAGHVMRCLALAQAWQAAGGQSTFVMAMTSPAFSARLAEEGVQLVPLTVEPGSRDDATQTAKLARQLGAVWVVVDGYHFSSAYQYTIKEAGCSLLFIDDYGHAPPYGADLVLNQNIYAHESLYLARESTTQLLLGLQYALLRREFWPWRDWQHEIALVARKVLITLGGADPDNVTLKVIQALQHVQLEKLEVKVIVGDSNPHGEVLSDAIKHSKHAICLEYSVVDMPALMAWADLAISAGGSTCWELAFMGLPNLVLILADNQQRVAEALDAAGVLVNLGYSTSLTATILANALTELAVAPEKRADKAQRGRALVDGVGATRVVRQMQAYQLTLKPVQADDCRLIWEWVNDPIIRAGSFSPDPIPWEDHMAWFTAKLADPDCFFYLAFANAVPVGQIRYQVTGQEAVVSVSLASGQRGRGYGSQLIRLGSQQIFNDADVNLIHAYIKSDNAASIGVFTKAGFIPVDSTEIQGYGALHCLLRKEMQS